MIYSMTGYATQTLMLDQTTIQLEIKAVNNRFLDLSIKSSDEFRAMETKIRHLIAEKINRGKLELRISTKDSTPTAAKLELNIELLQQYLNISNLILQDHPLIEPLSLSTILSLPGMLISPALALDSLAEKILPKLDSLIEDLQQAQASEGSKLEEFMRHKLASITKLIASAAPLVSQASADYYAKLSARIGKVLADAEISDTRLQQEFALFCQKIDITEELERLSAHVQEFISLLKQGGFIGKRLDFLCQEMHREANTFGAKSVAITSTHQALELKVQIEQIREQIQNIM